MSNPHPDSGQRRGRRPLVAGIGIAFLALVIGAVYVSSYGDYEPHAKVSGAIAAALDARHGLDAACAAADTKPERAAIAGALERASFPRQVAGHTLRFAPDGTATLEVDLADIAWGAPWRFGETAIRAGSKIIFDGGCAAKGRFEWRYMTTTLPREFLPTSLRGKR